ncbi:MAG: hypothetical protein NC483_00730 [Ruminococcus sp.]|nr:hypothetical protein [Ruminococcus sp.]
MIGEFNFPALPVIKQSDIDEITSQIMIDNNISEDKQDIVKITVNATLMKLQDLKKIKIKNN